MPAASYEGSLVVLDGSFQLWAERFIVHARDAEPTDIYRVVFQFGTRWERRDYPAHSSAERQRDGRFVSPPFPFREAGAGPPGMAYVVLTCVVEMPDGCRVAGEWHEEGEYSRFEGELEPFAGADA